MNYALANRCLGGLLLSRVRLRPADAKTVAALAVFLAIAGASSIAVAGGPPPPPPPDTSTGKVGVFGWEADSEASPAGSCRYGVTIDGNYYNYLHKLGVDAPVAYARPSRMTQRVGFRLTLQRFDGQHWVKGARSGWSIKTATPGDPAPFQPRALKVPFAPNSGPSRRAKVELRWYGRNGHTVAGTATMFPDWYESTEMATTFSQAERCGGTTG